jgi:cytochrome c-type protein NapB
LAIFGSAALAALFFAVAAAAQSDEVTSLRGAVPLMENTPAPDVTRQNTDGRKLDRAYRQQPPLIPHRIDNYEIDLKVNQCVRCHDWPYNIEEGAPKISETHYVNRDGVALDDVTPSRWFCTQCHVPQAQTRALIGNDFRSAAEVE